MPPIFLQQDELLRVAKEEGLVAFRTAVCKFPDQTPYAFCFYTDNDVTGLYPAIATEQSFVELCGKDSEPDPTYYRWAPAEWQLCFGEDDLMPRTNGLLRPPESDYTADDPNFAERKRAALRTLSLALLGVREQLFPESARSLRPACWPHIGDPYGEEDWMFETVLPRLHADDARDLRAFFELSF